LAEQLLVNHDRLDALVNHAGIGATSRAEDGRAVGTEEPKQFALPDLQIELE
jgi:hypothetical protein